MMTKRAEGNTKAKGAQRFLAICCSFPRLGSGGGSLIYFDTKKKVIGEDKITACLVYEDVRHKSKSSTKVYL